MKIKYTFLLFFVMSLLISCKKTEKEYYPNGQLKSVIEYRNGKEHGTTIYYDDTYSNPSLEIVMKDGTPPPLSP